MRVRLLCLLVLFLIFQRSASADAIYTYSGNTFTTATSPFNTSDSVHGSFTVSSPLAANLVNQTVDPTAFSFTDGVDTLALTGSGSFLFNGVSGYSNFYTFDDVSTNAAGAITAWYIEIYAVVGATEYGLDTYRNSTPNSGIDNGYRTPSTTGLQYLNYTTADSGVWTETASVAAAPEPSSLLLLGTGLIGFCGTVKTARRA